MIRIIFHIISFTLAVVCSDNQVATEDTSCREAAEHQKFQDEENSQSVKQLRDSTAMERMVRSLTWYFFIVNLFRLSFYV